MATAVAGTLTAPLGAKTQHSYLLGTGTTGGTYYPVGVAIATLVKVKLEPKAGIAMSAITSAGSGENLKLLRENQVQFAILQG
ncbi:MAG: C4-dicarboxylate ABC transporter substrate-binding protein, partial [Rhodospirillaceae bacterium]|nr:C4-dicarboxylate ABC transporter substrate-binding protein [Rhodospirillaceae bacterium]